MADIELVIKIPEGLKKDFESEQWTALSCMEMKNALEKATPLPKEHGDLVDRDAINDRFDSIYDEAMCCSCAPTYKYLLDKFSMCLDTEKPIIEGTYNEDENNE